MLWVPESGITEQGVDGGQAGVAGAYAIATLVFKMVEEVGDQRSVEVGDVELGGLFADLMRGKADQEPQSVAVGSHGLGAGVPLAGQSVGEEGLQGGASALMKAP